MWTVCDEPNSEQLNESTGNSGGPAFSSLEEGRICGVAFSKLSHADNIGSPAAPSFSPLPPKFAALNGHIGAQGNK